MPSVTVRVGFTLLTVVLLLGVASRSGWAQATGTVTGVVIEATSQRPLASAQVSIPGTGIGTLTNADGRYLLVNVPAGEHTVRVQLLGFGADEQSVTVVAGESVSADFGLGQSAIELGEIVVTGVGEATERRRIGNVIESINLAELENAPIKSPTEVLQARTPGVIVGTTGGSPGAGANIRIRGTASLTQSNQPIIYVDGVRIDASRSNFFSSASSASRLDDINPEAIERIEILKGAAAATLYGTEASNGVIQIFTKDGRAGAPRWTLSVGGGFSRHPRTIPPLAGFALAEEPTPGRDRGTLALSEHWGMDIQPYEVFEFNLYDHLLETGRHLEQSLSVSGGTDLVTYFVSGRYARADGVIGAKQYDEPGAEIYKDINDVKQLTANLQLVPAENLRLELSTRFAHRVQNPPHNSQGPIAISKLSKIEQAHEFNYIGRTAFSTVRESMREIYSEAVKRYGGALTARYALTPSLNVDVTTGLDVVSGVSTFYRPYGWNVDGYSNFTPTGDRQIGNRHHSEFTIDGKVNWSTDLGEQFTTALVVGTQTLIANTQFVEAQGEDFPAAGLEVVGAATILRADESILRTVNSGAFAQGQIGFRDYLFVTTGARVDRHSAFGEDAGAAIYPKLSASFVASDMPDWTAIGPVSTLRLRAAIGQSGLQPGAFDRFTTFAPVTAVAGGGLTPENLGNPDIRPEVSTEWEAGFEAGLFNDRIALEATYWNRTVTDLLVDRQFPPSGGFVQRQLDNIGQMKAWGVDLGVSGTAYSGSTVSVDFFANGAFLREKITDMGGAPPIGGGNRELHWIREGYAPTAQFGGKLVDAEYPFDTNGDGQVDSREQLLDYLSQPRTVEQLEALAVGVPCENGGWECHYLGKPVPDWAGSFGANVSIGDFSVATTFEYKVGNYRVAAHALAFRKGHPSIGRNTPTSARWDAQLMNPASTPEERLEAARWFSQNAFSLVQFNGLNQVHNANLIRWRELSLTYRIPSDLVNRFGADGVSITAAGRNLLLLSPYPGLDPETVYVDNLAQGHNGHILGIPQRFSLTARVNF